MFQHKTSFLGKIKNFFGFKASETPQAKADAYVAAWDLNLKEAEREMNQPKKVDRRFRSISNSSDYSPKDEYISSLHELLIEAEQEMEKEHSLMRRHFSALAQGKLSLSEIVAVSAPDTLANRESSSPVLTAILTRLIKDFDKKYLRNEKNLASLSKEEQAARLYFHTHGYKLTNSDLIKVQYPQEPWYLFEPPKKSWDLFEAPKEESWEDKIAKVFAYVKTQESSPELRIFATHMVASLPISANEKAQIMNRFMPRIAEEKSPAFVLKEQRFTGGKTANVLNRLLVNYNSQEALIKTDYKWEKITIDTFRTKKKVRNFGLEALGRIKVKSYEL